MRLAVSHRIYDAVLIGKEELAVHTMSLS